MLYHDYEKDELGDIYQVVGSALKMGRGGGINGLRKPKKAEKHAYL